MKRRNCIGRKSAAAGPVMDLAVDPLECKLGGYGRYNAMALFAALGLFSAPDTYMENCGRAKPQSNKLDTGK